MRKSAWPRSRNLLLQFWDPSIFTEWRKLQTSSGRAHSRRGRGRGVRGGISNIL